MRMIIQCQSCAARYFLPQEKVPTHPLKVRCPKCGAVFMLAPRVEPVAVGAPTTGSETRRVPENARPAPAPAATLTTTDTPTDVAPPRRPREARAGEERARRLARVLVSDILWYNREKRDLALRDGTLMTALGDEIKKSWELYKEKVGPEAALSTNYFKEALNEILADGQEVF
jgi:predicted Zn finger-like uncharacterized protein